jgi:two-component system cell cycle response regulator
MNLPLLLLVDDNQEILDFLFNILVADYNILTAGNGREAEELLNNEPINLVISDVMMPEMDGFELCKFIRTSPKVSHLPVILLTAKDTMLDKIEGLELGADAYIEKPFSPIHLKAQILNLLNRHVQLRSYFGDPYFTQSNWNIQNNEDHLFIDKISNIIQKEIDDSDLDIDYLAEAVHMSRMTLYRRIKSICDMTPHEFINSTRLKKSVELLSVKKIPDK